MSRFMPGRPFSIVYGGWAESTGLEPFDGGEVKAVLMREKTPGIDRRGLRPFGQADAPAGQILWRLHRPIRPDIDGGMTVDAGREDRDPDQIAVVL